MTKATVAAKQPAAINVQAGETYYWCTCGKSDKQPFCDGSHEGTTFAPLAYTPEKNDTVYLCQCKHTRNAPFCDGAHQALD